MLECNIVTDIQLSLVTRLAEAGGASTTRRGLAQRLVSAFQENMKLDRFELGFWEPGTKTLRLYRHGQTHENELEGTTPEIYQRRHGGWLLRDADRPCGWALIEPEPAAELEAPIVAIVSAALRQCQRLERVAGVSRDAHRDGQRLRDRIAVLSEHDAIVARSDAMRRILNQVELVAEHDTTVLILGETGTGKELVARQIHERSRRAREPYVQVNCGALPDTLIESELFGHERGAFTGAVRRHRGRFERADGGTLLLDEVGELPPSAQVKLLRALQEGEIEPLGAERTRRVDVRILAATHRPLEKLVETGAFREDLFYRLSVFPVRIPPLRQRPDDIVPLAEALLRRISTTLDRPFTGVGPAVLGRLREYDWPGNVRELHNVLERSLILTPRNAPVTKLAIEPVRRSKLRAQTLDDATRDAIAAALDASNGKIYGPGGAAERLRVKPTTLQSKMKKLGITG